MGEGTPIAKRIDAPSAASPVARLPLLDAARGLAVVAMVIYHFSWDLRYFGYIASDVEGAPGWRAFAHGIAGTFLFIVGVSLVLSTRNGLNARKFIHRLGVLVAAALAITLVTWLIFPDSYIFFGILHHIALASVLGLVFLNLPVPIVVVVAILCFAAPPLFAGPAFDRPWLLWLGFETVFPRSNDFVPLLPWFGVVLFGLATARTYPDLLRGGHRLLRVEPPRQLVWLGRWSLVIYLLHQPVLFGLVYLAAQVYPPGFLGFESTYLQTCAASCAESEVDAAICGRTCDCLAERSQAEGLWADLMRQTLTAEGERRYFTLADECRAGAKAD